MTEVERWRQSLPADAGRGDLLKTLIDRVEHPPNGLRTVAELASLEGISDRYEAAASLVI